MRFRYSSVRSRIAGSLVLPIQAILSFTRDHSTTGQRGTQRKRRRSFLRALPSRRSRRGRTFLGSTLGRRLQVVGLEPLGRLPQPFEFVIAARLLREDVDDKVHVVEQHPLSLVV